jgi:mono/diheme cytochrome c family protein
MRLLIAERRARPALAMAWLAALVVSTAAQAGPGEARPVPRDVRGIDGQSIRIVPEKGATAVIFYSTECPISNAYSPTLNAIAGEFPAGSFRMVGLCVDPDLATAAIRQHASEYALKFPVGSDRDGSLAAALGVKVTPEAVVIDAEGKIRYRGRIDDQFARRQVRNANPRTHELKDAIAAVLAGKEAPVAAVEAVGCPLPENVKPPARPTYSGEVASILQKNCQQCHRAGQVGPFSLTTYEQARKRAEDIANVAADRRMPPWKPVPGVGPAFKHSKALSEEQIATLTAWAEAGAPEGDPAAVPTPPAFPEDWSLGTPDLVLEPAEDFAIPASGEDIYRCFVIPTKLGEDKYIAAIEYRPGNRKVVHHVLSYVDTSGEARKKDEADPGQGYSCFSGPGVQIHGDLGGWAPGNEPVFLPEGVGRSLPKGGDVIMQVHYHPSGKPEVDRTRIGIHFSKVPVKQTLHWTAALDRGMKLPAGQSNIEIKAGMPMPCDVTALAVTPHMHLLGKDMTIAVVYPDKKVKPLVKIGDWDFNWQNTYYFAEPINLPKGSVLTVVAHFDNSSSNPRNPNRDNPVDVTWGEATTDEMCIGFLGVVKTGQDLTKPGEKDDLREIFDEFYQELRRKHEAEQKRKANQANNR